MDIKEALTKRKDHEVEVMAKAFTDDKFRADLLKDPKAVLEKERGKPFPAGLQIRVMEEPPNTVTLVLPRKPEPVSGTGELSDEALEQVAGGAIIYSTGTTVIW